MNLKDLFFPQKDSAKYKIHPLQRVVAVLIMLVILSLWVQKYSSPPISSAPPEKTEAQNDSSFHEQGTFEGTLSRVESSDWVWIKIDSRKGYFKWLYKLSKGNLSKDEKEVKVFLKYVSPSQSIGQSAKSNKLLNDQIIAELSKQFLNQPVRIEYSYSHQLLKVKGVVYVGKTSLNEWLIEKGWSFYLPDETPHSQADKWMAIERKAQDQKIGIWK